MTFFVKSVVQPYKKEHKFPTIRYFKSFQKGLLYVKFYLYILYILY